MDRERISASKFLSLVLRHQPETIGIRLDDQGWVEIDEMRGSRRYVHLSPDVETARKVGQRRGQPVILLFSFFRPQTPGPLKNSVGQPVRFPSPLGFDRPFPLPHSGIATTEKKVGKRIWGKGMGAERKSHSLARNSLAIFIRNGLLIAIGVDRPLVIAAASAVR